MIRDVPFIIRGEKYSPSEGSHRLLTLDNGSVVRFPILDAAMTKQIVEQDTKALEKLSLHEIVGFLYNAGQSWKSKEYTRRKMYIRALVSHLGFSEKMAELEANWISMLLSSHAVTYDIVTTELGSRHILDKWVLREEAEVRAYPKGLSLHTLAGNVPLSGVGSIVRALITKNSVVVKSSSGDPFTPLFLAQSFQDIEANHPVTQAMSVINWAGGQEGALEDQIARAADVICAWGGRDAMRWAARYASEKTDVVKFGPKRSLAVVTQGSDLKAAARCLAHDVSYYDQRACFSVQQVFTDVDLGEFIPHLVEAMNVYKQVLPKGFHDFDEKAARTLAVSEALFMGMPFYHDPEGSWAFAVCSPEFVGLHPLGRTLFIHPIKSVDEVAQYVDGDVQTVAVMPFHAVEGLRDRMASKGVSRFVELGMNNIFRAGTAHDGIFPLQHLVRLSSTEQPSALYTKTMTIRIDQTSFLENDRFVEFVP